MKALKSLSLPHPHPLFIILVAYAFSTAPCYAQEQMSVSLSNPGSPGELHADIIRGSISINGYDGQEVLISYDYDGFRKNDQPSVTEDGLRRISNNAAGFEVSENNNEIEISGASPLQNLELEISVPRNFSLYLSTVNGTLLAENVSGEMELSNVNGDILLHNIGGTVLANTVNGDIEAIFRKVNPDKPMAFSNLNGDIDVTLPASANLSAKMKSEWGEVYTDFDMDVKQTADNGQREESSAGNKIFKISVNNWIYGDINSGGPEYLFKSMRGNIYIRKSS